MNELNRTSQSRLTTEAADWYARLRADDLSELDSARFRAWLARSPAHRQEFDALGALWNDLSAIENSPEVSCERVAPNFAIDPCSAASMTLANGAGRRGDGAIRGSPWPKAGRVAALAAGVVAILAAVVWTRELPADHYTTGIGEQRVIPLRDGTVVTLNTATELKLHYSRRRRTVELVSGQVNFEVAKDPSRPFVVMAGGGEVRAVGTVFDVYKAGDQVTVTLIEGKVQVIPRESVARRTDSEQGNAQSHELSLQTRSSRTASLQDALTPDGEEFYLTAGQQVSYGMKNGSVKAVTADIPRVSAWKERKLDFDNTPLADAIAEANRYSRVQIQLDAPQLQTARISGTFEAGKNDQFAEGLQSYFRMKVEREEDNRIVLSVPR